MKINHADLADSFYEVAGNIRSGERTVKALLTGRENAADNYKLAYSYGEKGSEWATPRHRHAFEQVRHPLEGDYSIGKNKVLRAGWVGYFPESAYYGPQVMSPNLKMVVLQYGGPSGRGFYSIPQRKAAMDVLKTKGTFSNGIFSWVDEQGTHHNQDAGEAVWEQMFNEKMVYPPSRYEDLIMINPANFDWIKDENVPGVSHKRLGTFSERDVRIGFIKVDAGASLRFGAERAAEVLFLKEGSVQHDGQAHPRLSAFSSEAAETPETLEALEPTEFFYVKMPTF
ncbi:hypothetical protein GCM10023322_64480 [Rugosimonospora acidiphila]|uniref:Uncharacterized protein n=1 Tax=Rugosimonospora acidiphila TaxID=556531 RepID=A0ABP9SJH8_9ACTN